MTMDNDQIVTELRDLADRADRLEVSTDQNIAELRIMAERHIPAAVAQVRHTLSGTSEIVANLAGTVHSLAAQVHALTDRIVLLERVVDQGLPPDDRGR